MALATLAPLQAQLRAGHTGTWSRWSIKMWASPVAASLLSWVEPTCSGPLQDPLRFFQLFPLQRCVKSVVLSRTDPAQAPCCLPLLALEWPPHSCSGSQGLTLRWPLLGDQALSVFQSGINLGDAIPARTSSIILAWRSLWTEEPGGLQPIGSRRVKHD